MDGPRNSYSLSTYAKIGQQRDRKDYSMKQFARTLFLSMVMLTLSVTVFAQVTGARLTGIVTDSSNAAVPGAQLTITNTNTNTVTHAVADDHGEYNIPTLPAGSYTISTKAKGFAETVQSNIVLTIGQNASLNVALQVGGESETVNVTSNPTIINSSTAEISQVVNESSIKSLPLNGRDPSSLAFYPQALQMSCSRKPLRSRAATRFLHNPADLRQVDDKEARTICWTV